MNSELSKFDRFSVWWYDMRRKDDLKYSKLMYISFHFGVILVPTLGVLILLSLSAIDLVSLYLLTLLLAALFSRVLGGWLDGLERKMFERYCELRGINWDGTDIDLNKLTPL